MGENQTIKKSVEMQEDKQESSIIFPSVWRVPAGIAGVLAMLWPVLSSVYFCNLFVNYVSSYPTYFWSLVFAFLNKIEESLYNDETIVISDLKHLLRWACFGFGYSVVQYVAIDNIVNWSYQERAALLVSTSVAWIVFIAIVWMYILELRRFVYLTTRNIQEVGRNIVFKVVTLY